MSTHCTPPSTCTRTRAQTCAGTLRDGAAAEETQRAGQRGQSGTFRPSDPQCRGHGVPSLERAQPDLLIQGAPAPAVSSPPSALSTSHKILQSPLGGSATRDRPFTLRGRLLSPNPFREHRLLMPKPYGQGAAQSCPDPELWPSSVRLGWGRGPFTQASVNT